MRQYKAISMLNEARCDPGYFAPIARLRPPRPRRRRNARREDEPIVDPLVPSNRWYLLAVPETALALAFGFLEGATGPQVATGPIQGVKGLRSASLTTSGGRG